MKLTIEMDLNSAAFDDAGAYEVGRILADLATRIPDPLRDTNGELVLHDFNGNNVGFARIDND